MGNELTRRDVLKGSAAAVVGLAIGKADLAIRPHAVQLFDGSDGGSDTRGTVRRTVYGGDHMEYDVLLTGFTDTVFVIDQNVSAPWPEGHDVSVRFSPTGLSLLPAAVG